ncbi:MAG TPA: hypothetical protein VEG43_05255, partial [Dehalococcoidia bacterium]|nr:hypothetical protein [Dehalococcoidia bacterium]
FPGMPRKEATARMAIRISNSPLFALNMLFLLHISTCPYPYESINPVVTSALKKNYRIISYATPGILMT